MTLFGIVICNLRYYWRQHIGVVIGAALCSMVLVGALMVGDSVKATLKRLADERIGQADVALLATDGFFREQLAEDMAEHLGSGVVVAPVALTQGNVSVLNSDRNVANVQVLGVDERFWKLTPQLGAVTDFGNSRDFFVNEHLARRLEAKVGDKLRLTIEMPSLLPRDDVLSGKSNDDDIVDTYAKPLARIVGPEAFGRFGLQGNQREPPTIFVPLKVSSKNERSEGLQSQMFKFLEEETGEVEYANLLLMGRPGDEKLSFKQAESALEKAWTLADAGISVEQLEAHWSIRSQQVFLGDSLRRAGESLRLPGAESLLKTTGVLTYFVDTISKVRADQDTTAGIPYSMVAAADAKQTALLPNDLQDHEIVLNKWAVDDLNVSSGDSVSLKYYVLDERRQLVAKTETMTVRWAKQAPTPEDLHDLNSSDWTPMFPGLSKAEKIAKWETDIPFDEARFEEEDDLYWEDHRDSPKAFITLRKGQDMWENRWGSLTGLRISKDDASQAKIEEALRQKLSPGEAGLLIRSLRQDAFEAAESPIDFGQLFLGFSFFVIVAALALTGMLFAFVMEQRNRQAGLLLAVGLPSKMVRRIFLTEGLLLSLAGALAGTFLAIYYGSTILGLLTGEWSGAVSGATFDFSANPVSIATGFLSAVTISLLAMWWSTRRQLQAEPKELLSMGENLSATAPLATPSGQRFGKTTIILALVLLLASFGMTFATDLSGPFASMLFFGAGWCLLAAGLLFFKVRLLKAAFESGAFPNAATLSRRNAARRSGRSLVTAGAMAAGAFLVVGTGAFRKDASTISGEPTSGTGGFDLIGETALPIYDDLNGEKSFELFEGLDRALLEGTKFVQLRVREGDDASCLNLNKALRPRLYGVKPSELAGLFSFAEGDWSTLEEPTSDGSIPAVVDQNTMMWALKKGVGDLIEYRDGEGKSFQVKLSAVAKGSMLQGALYVDEQRFKRKFPKQGGYRGFFLNVPADKVQSVADHLTDQLVNHGMELRPAKERLAELQEVENTYISIFQALGGLGLLFGTAGLAVVVARNLLERSREFGLMEAVGYSLATLRQLASAEHRGLAFWGLGIGVVSATLGIAPMLLGAAGQKPGVGFIWLLASLLLLCVFWIWLAVTLVLRKSQMSSLRDQ